MAGSVEVRHAVGGARKLGRACSCKTRGGARRLVEKLRVAMVSQGLGLEGWEWQW